MHAALDGAQVFASSSSGSTLEIAVVAAAVVLAAVLLLLRARRSRDHRLRSGAGVGYYDRDVARYVHSGGTGAAPTDLGNGSLAPTFTSTPKRSKRFRGKPPPAVPTPVSPPRPVPSFGPSDLTRAEPVPVFDQATAVATRPPPSMPPPRPATVAVPPPPPPPPGGSVSPAQAPVATTVSTLPTLEQPPPPSPPAEESPAR
jgi:hypothetical protein